jgi:uncharacterized protein YbjT (DUF2867 family)
MKTAIIAGSTGLVGSALLSQLLIDTDFEAIIIFVRKPIDKKHQKLSYVLVDFENIEAQPKQLSATHAFCCLGTTIKKAGSKDVQYRIDHDYVLAFAKACKAIGVKSFTVVSSLGADAQSKNFYLNTKGIMEADLIKIGFENLHILRPSLLLGKRNEFRLGEKIAMAFMKVFSSFFIGSLKKYKGISAEMVANAMIILSKRANKAVAIYENDALLGLGK